MFRAITIEKIELNWCCGSPSALRNPVRNSLAGLGRILQTPEEEGSSSLIETAQFHRVIKALRVSLWGFSLSSPSICWVFKHFQSLMDIPWIGRRTCRALPVRGIIYCRASTVSAPTVKSPNEFQHESGHPRSFFSDKGQKRTEVKKKLLRADFVWHMVF